MVATAITVLIRVSVVVSRLGFSIGAVTFTLGVFRFDLRIVFRDQESFLGFAFGREAGRCNFCFPVGADLLRSARLRADTHL